ncbi:ATP-binding protein [Kitasatospora sp. NPDC098663]|uniref:ATP-binding protein n=1 Tax=Kitasatospora sp. NPDC098663 TaxID=3364096 RepID=UPI0038189CD1
MKGFIDAMLRADLAAPKSLEILLVKPGAFAGAAALAQARAEGGFTRVHEAFWAAAKQKAGDREGTRMLIEVLLLHRQLPAAAVVAGMETVLKVGSVSTDLVAIEARKAIENSTLAVATNSPFAEWDRIFADPRLCAAIADRITFRCTLIQTGTESYRFQATEAERQAKPTR